MPFYTFYQNNSGGSFLGPAHYVVIEAPSANSANALAEDQGVYFNGCENGNDCPCCGDRWYEASEGFDEPTIYGESIEDALENAHRVYGGWSEFKGGGIPQICVFYLDGSKKPYQ